MPIRARQGSSDGSQPPKWRRYARRILLIIEIIAVVGFLLVGSKLWRMQSNLQRELVVAERVKSALIDAPGAADAGAGGLKKPEVKEVTATHPPVVRVVGRIRLVIPALDNATFVAEREVWDPTGEGAEPKVLSTVPGEPGDLTLESLSEAGAQSLPDLHLLRVGNEILLIREQITFRYQIREVTVMEADEAWDITGQPKADLILISSAVRDARALRLVVFAYLEDVEMQ